MSYPANKSVVIQGDTVEELNEQLDQLKKRLADMESMLQKTAPPYVPREKVEAFKKSTKVLKAA
jgi:hypothetical protein